MSYIPDEIKESWKEIAQALLDSDGGLGNKCKLYFQNEIIPNANKGFVDTASSKPRFMPSYGGLSTPNSMPGYEDSAFTSASGFYQNENVKTIYGKIYGNPKDFDNAVFAQGSTNLWKFICDKKYIPDIMRASYAVFYADSDKEFKTKLTRPPVTYGLGSDVNAMSYWTDF